jgi:hypothetical protein
LFIEVTVKGHPRKQNLHKQLYFIMQNKRI